MKWFFYISSLVCEFIRLSSVNFLVITHWNIKRLFVWSLVGRFIFVAHFWVKFLTPLCGFLVGWYLIWENVGFMLLVTEAIKVEQLLPRNFPFTTKAVIEYITAWRNKGDKKDSQMRKKRITEIFPRNESKLRIILLLSITLIVFTMYTKEIWTIIPLHYFVAKYFYRGLGINDLLIKYSVFTKIQAEFIGHGLLTRGHADKSSIMISDPRSSSHPNHPY